MILSLVSNCCIFCFFFLPLLFLSFYFFKIKSIHSSVCMDMDIKIVMRPTSYILWWLPGNQRINLDWFSNVAFFDLIDIKSNGGKTCMCYASLFVYVRNECPFGVFTSDWLQGWWCIRFGYWLIWNWSNIT